MKHINLSKKTIWGGLLLLGAAAVLVACGGASQEDESWKQDPRVMEAMKFGANLPVSWAPSSLTFSMNPGGKQDVPVTFTTTKALKNARVIFVPDLRNAVTVTPATIPALEAGQSMTVTLSFAPAVTDTRKFLAGVVLLFDQNATVSKPLLAKVSLVKPETINGVVVPPEPPPELNNATLAGFDTNGNGVRDDVDRWIAVQVPGSARHRANLLADANAEQRGLVSTTSEEALAAARDSARTIGCYRSLGIPRDQRKWRESLSVLLNTPARLQAYDAYQRKLTGEVFVASADQQSPCLFDLNSLPN